MRQRAHCVLLSFQGYTPKELAHIFHVDRITIYQIPPDLVVKYQPIDIVDVILWRVLRPRFVLQREIKGRATLTP